MKHKRLIGAVGVATLGLLLVASNMRLRTATGLTVPS